MLKELWWFFDGCNDPKLAGSIIKRVVSKADGSVIRLQRQLLKPYNERMINLIDFEKQFYDQNYEKISVRLRKEVEGMTYDQLVEHFTKTIVQFVMEDPELLNELPREWFETSIPIPPGTGSTQLSEINSTQSSEISGPQPSGTNQHKLSETGTHKSSGSRKHKQSGTKKRRKRTS